MENWKAAVKEAKTFIDLTEIFKSVLDVDPIELVPKVEPVQPGAHKDEKTPYGLKARGVKTREKLNAKAREIIERVTAPEDLSHEDQEILLQYSGRGGLTENSQFEYYTPTHVAEGMWDMLKESGFENGNVLDPCTGAGVFSGTKPEGVIVSGADIDPVGSKVAQLLNPEDTIENKSFEKLVMETEDNTFDGAVGNVPFGDVRGASAHDDPEYKNEKRIERYFILRLLDKIKPGKLACLVVPINIVGAKGSKWSLFRTAVSMKAEFLGAHKLPSKTFSAQGTDTVTDIVVFRKHPQDLLDRIEDYRIEDLEAANVVWDEFLQGKYWQGEGRRFIHGKYVPKIDGDRWSRETVDSDVDNEGLKRKLAMKFPGRIDWGALEVAEPVIRNYAEGDRRIINGQEFEMQNGTWTKVAQADESEKIDAAKYGAETLDELKGLLEAPGSALKFTVAQMFAIFKAWPHLMKQIHKDAVEFAMSQTKDDFYEQAYRGTLIGGMIGRYQNKANSGTADDTERLALQELIVSEIERYGHPKENKRITITGESSRAYGLFHNAVDEKGNFSALLAGTVEDTGIEYNPADIQSIVEHLFVREGITQIELEDIQKLYAGKLKIESLGDLAEHDGVAITPDGMIMPIGRYCAGDIYSKIDDMTVAMADETDDRIIAKYQAQIDLIKKKRTVTNKSDIAFGFQQKWFSRKYIVKFLKENGYSSLTYGVWEDEEREDSITGDVKTVPVFKPDFDTPFGEFKGIEAPGFRKQFQKFLNGGKVTSSKQELIEEYKNQVADLTERFNIWMQQHPEIDEVTAQYNRKFNGYVPYDYSGDLKLKGVSKNVKLHDYQARAVQKLSEEGRGCLALDVGLGKTFASLGLHAYNKQMGRTKKSCIVVPKSVLANWYHESKDILGNMSDVLFVGFRPKVNRKTGKVEREQVKDEQGSPKKNKHTGELVYQDKLLSDNAEAVWEKMWEIPQTNKSLVVMTKEKFGAIPMKAESKAQYVDKMVERSLISEKLGDKTLDEADAADKKRVTYDQDKARMRKEQQYADEGTRKKGEYPYFEDMGFSSVITDEAHEFKNSYQAGDNTKDIAYLPTAPSAKRALDMALKMNYLRDTNNGRGSYQLTATPVTNSPFEIFNMLSLVCPVEEFEQFNIYTVDDFVRVFGKIEQVDKVMVSGDVKSKDGLVGFQNLDGLRNLFHKYVHMRNADDVSLPLPPHEEVNESVELTAEQQEIYEELREDAKEAAKPKSGISMFSVIRDMDRVTTDLDLYMRTMTFLMRESDKEQIDALLDTIPKSIKVRRPSEDDSTKMVTAMVPFKYETRLENESYVVVVPEEFEEHIVTRLPNHSIDEKTVGHPVMPKYAKLIKNIQKELNKGKQLIFTEEKSQHNKILRIIVHQVPMLAEALGIINADTANGNKLQKLSDSYNSGKTKVMIANKKAEVGVNLQKGTTAIHHMTLPWTPASIQQRNGRGIRQGNTAKHINVYYYLGKGSFDLYRLDLLKRKSNWMKDLFFGDEAEAENANAMQQDEFMDMLEADPEAAKARRLERLAAKEAERQKKKARQMKNMLQALASKVARLDNLDTIKAEEKERIDSQLEKAEAKRARTRENLKEVNDAIEQGGDPETMEELERRRSRFEAVIGGDTKKIDRLKLRQKGLDAKYEQLKTNLQDQTKRDQAYLEGQAKAGILPFDEKLIQKPGNAVVKLDGTVITKGDCYEVVEDFGDYSSAASGSKNSLLKITYVDAAARKFNFEVISGRFVVRRRQWGEENYPTSAFDVANLKKVTYTDKELEVRKLLAEEIGYDDLIEGKISKETFLEYRSEMRFDDYAPCVLKKDGKIALESLRSSGADIADVVYPDPKNESFKKAVCEACLELVRKGELDYTTRGLMRSLYGDNFDEIAIAYGKRATEAEIRAEVARQWKKLIDELVDDPTDPNQIEGAIHSWNFDDKMIEAVRPVGDNTAEIDKITREFIAAKTESLHEQIRQKEAEAKKAELDAIKNHPDYKEVPANVKEAFGKLGITVKTNMTKMVIPGYRGRRGTPVEPFKKWYFQDKNGKSGALFRTKNILKARYSAKFFSNADDVFQGAWWHVPISTDLQQVYELMA